MPKRPAEIRLVRALFVVAWAYGFVSSLISIAQVGRPDRLVGGETFAQSSLSNHVAKFLVVVCAFLALAVIVVSARNRDRGAWTLVVVILPGLMTVISYWLAGGQVLNWNVPVFFLVAAAIWRSGLGITDLTIVGWITGISASLSLFLGLTDKSLALFAQGDIGEKALYANIDLLAGPYSHPNQLGFAMALGLPFVFLIKRRSVRRFFFVVAVLALLWSGNRNAMAAAALVMVAGFVLRRRPLWIKAVPYGLVALAALDVWLPLHRRGVNDYDGRGQIWAVSLDEWRRQPWFGFGPHFYSNQLQYNVSIGGTAFQGHSIFVHELVTTGLVGLATVTLFIAVAAIRGLRSEQPVIASVFIASVLLASLLENPSDFLALTPQAYTYWMPMAVIVCGPVTQRRIRKERRPAKLAADDRRHDERLPVG